MQIDKPLDFHSLSGTSG